MVQDTESLQVWRWANTRTEYIVATREAADAVRVFERVVGCRGKVPQPYSVARSGAAGRALATGKPGAMYRRARKPSAECVN